MGNEIWPSAVDYVEAAECLAGVANDHVVRDCQIERTPLGLPVAASGQNAIVFRVKHGVERIALRCFTTAAGDSGAHYGALERFLAEHPLPALAHASWRTDAMVVNGRPRPVLLMEWIDGVPLHRAIEERLSDAAALRELAADWSTLARTVAASGMAHGDYQHGNVLVTSDGELRLVDFDGAWLPDRPDAAYREFGHRNYQHPERAATADHGPAVDGFAALLIWLSIRAVAASPALWATFHDGDNLLATERDLRDPDAPLWTALASSPDPEVCAAALRLRAATLRPAADAGSVAELLFGTELTSSEVCGRTADRLPTPPVPHAPAGPVAAPRRDRGRALTAAACVGLVLAVAIGVAGASTGGAGTSAVPGIARTDDASVSPADTPSTTVPSTTVPSTTTPATTPSTTVPAAVPPTVAAPPAAPPAGNDVPVAPPTTLPAAPPADEAPPTSTPPPTTAPPTTAPPTTAPPTTVAPASFVVGNLLGLDGVAVDEALRARGVTVRWFPFRSSRPINTVVDQRLVMPGAILTSGITIDLGYSDNGYCAAHPAATTCMLSTQLP